MPPQLPGMPPPGMDPADAAGHAAAWATWDADAAAAAPDAGAPANAAVPMDPMLLAQLMMGGAGQPDPRQAS